jgi:hypothetical protein
MTPLRSLSAIALAVFVFSCSDEGTDPADVGADTLSDGAVADAGTDAEVAADVAPDTDVAPDADVELGPRPDPTTIEFPAGPPRVPRLTSLQFENAIHDLLGPDIVVPRNIEPDLETAGFLQIGAAAATISPRGVEKYEDATYEITGQFIDDQFRSEFDCTPAGARDDGCAAPLLEALALHAFRRPPTDAEVAVLVEVAGNAGDVLDDFYEGLEFGIAAIIQSPSFLFRVELGAAETGTEGLLAYDDWALASRLSFLIWNTIPDAELLETAASGALATDEGLRAQTERLLASPRARDGLSVFFEELYELHALDGLNKDPTVYPTVAPDLGVAARTETLMMLEDLVFDREADFREALTSRHTFLNRRLAALYDVRAPAREGFAAAELPVTANRVGLLGHASILALTAHATSTSPTLRGIFVRERILCGVIPPPPAGVDTSIPAATEAAPTIRERVAQHLEDEFCAGCHQLMDPLGLALENYDGIGAYRTQDNGHDVDASGNLDSAPFDDLPGLIQLLSEDPRVTSCLVQKLNRYANSAVDNREQINALDDLHLIFAHEGYRVQPLILNYVLSPAFRTVGEVVIDE